MVGIPALSGPLKQFKSGRQQWQGTLIFKYLCGLVQPLKGNAQTEGLVILLHKENPHPKWGFGWMDYSARESLM